MAELETTSCPSCLGAVLTASTHNGRVVLDAAPDRHEGTYTVVKGFDGLQATFRKVAERFGRTLYRKHPAPCRRPRPRVPAHAFELDDQVPADHTGRRFCASCGIAGEPGDDRHPAGALPATQRRFPPTPAAAAELDRRRAGERAGG